MGSFAGPMWIGRASCTLAFLLALVVLSFSNAAHQRAELSLPRTMTERFPEKVAA